MINETVILLLWRMDVFSHLYLNFYKPLQKIFSKVIPYEYYRRTTQIGVKGINEEVIKLVRKEHPKYVLWVSVWYEFLESTFDSIRKEGSIVIGWFMDDECCFNYYSKWWIPHLDYCVTIDIEAVPKYKALGARVIQAFPCEGVPISRDWSNIEERYDVSFVGSTQSKPGREQYINELRNRSIPVHVFGEGGGRYLPFGEMIDVLKASKINLNFSRATHSNRMGIKGRIPLVCLAGGFLLTEYVPGIENYFEIDKEIVCFKTAEEMIDKVTHYLNHETERRAIAQAGWKRATSEYTPFHVLSKVFGEIEADVVAKDKESSPHPQELKMPRWLRILPSRYYLRLGREFLETNNKGLWKEALALSLAYNPFNIGARYYSIISLFPPFMRPPLFKLYKPYEAVKELCLRLGFKLLYWADTVPYLRNIKRRVANW